MSQNVGLKLQFHLPFDLGAQAREACIGMQREATR